MFRLFAVFVTVIIFLVALVGCDPPGSTTTLAADLLPELSGYNTIEGQSFTDALTTLGAMASLVGQPEFGAPITAIGGLMGCYQEAGAVSARVYSDQAEPRNSGVVAIGDRNALQNPLIFLRCVSGPVEQLSTESVTIKPCKYSYTLAREENEFYILYAGLTPDVCHAFCSNLEACTAH